MQLYVHRNPWCRSKALALRHPIGRQSTQRMAALPLPPFKNSETQAQISFEHAFSTGALVGVSHLKGISLVLPQKEVVLNHYNGGKRQRKPPQAMTRTTTAAAAAETLLWDLLTLRSLVKAGVQQGFGEMAPRMRLLFWTNN